MQSCDISDGGKPLAYIPMAFITYGRTYDFVVLSLGLANILNLLTNLEDIDVGSCHQLSAQCLASVNMRTKCTYINIGGLHACARV